MDPITAGLVSAGGNLLGGLISGHAQRKAAKDLNRQQNRVNRVNKAEVDARNARDIDWRQHAVRAARRANKNQQKAAMKADRIQARATNKNPINTANFMRDADRLGFNPVTYLQSGALSLYQRREGQSADIIMAGRGVDIELGNYDNPETALWQRSAPTVSTASYGPGMAIGDALTAGVNTFLAAQQQVDQNQFQREMVMTQLAAANRSGSGRGYSLGGVPSVHSTAGGASNGYLTTAPNADIGNTVSFDSTYGRLTNPNKIDSEAYIKTFGEVAGPVTEMIIEGPGVLRDPANQQTAQRSWQDWSQLAVDAAWELGKQASPGGTLKRTIQIAKPWIEKQITPTPENSRIMRRELDPNW